MADVIYEALEAFQVFMDKGSLSDVLAIFGVSALGSFVLIAAHECGHALAAVLLGRPVREVRVGDVDDFTITAGAFRLRLGRLRGVGDLGGYVIYDGRMATPAHALVIALAGPGANVVTAALGAALAIRADGPLAIVLLLWTVGSLLLAVDNLRPSGSMRCPEQWSDGRWIQLAWAAHRARHEMAGLTADPNAATSVPPPGETARTLL